MKRVQGRHGHFFRQERGLVLFGLLQQTFIFFRGSHVLSTTVMIKMTHNIKTVINFATESHYISLCIALAYRNGISVSQEIGLILERKGTQKAA